MAEQKIVHVHKLSTHLLVILWVIAIGIVLQGTSDIGMMAFFEEFSENPSITVQLTE